MFFLTLTLLKLMKKQTHWLCAALIFSFALSAAAQERPSDSLVQGEYIISEYGYTLGLQLTADGDGKFRAVVYADGLPGDGWNEGDFSILGTAVIKGSDITFTMTESRGSNTFGIDLPDSAEIKGKVTVEKAKEGQETKVPVKIELVSVAGMSDIPYGLYFEKQYRANKDSLIQGEYIISEYGYTLGLQLTAEGGGKFRAVVYADGLPGDGWKEGDFCVLGTAVLSGDDLALTMTETRGSNTFGIDLPSRANIKGKVTIEKPKAGQEAKVPVKIELISIGGMSDIPYGLYFEKLYREKPSQDTLIQGEYIISEYGYTLGMHLIAEGDGKFRAVAYADGLPGDGWKAGDFCVLGTAVLKGDEITFTMTETRGSNTFDIDLPSRAELTGKVTIEKPKEGQEAKVPVKIELVSVAGMSDIPYGLYLEKLYRENAPALGLPAAAAPAPALPKESTSRRDVLQNEAMRNDFLIQGEYLISEYGYTLGMHLIADSGGKFRVVAYADGLPGDGWSAGDFRLLGTAVVNGNDITFTLTDSRGNNTFGVDLPDRAEIKGKITIEQPQGGQGGGQGRGQGAGQFRNVPVKIELVSVAGMSDIPYGLYLEKQFRQSPTLGQEPPAGAVVLFDGSNLDWWLPGASMNEPPQRQGGQGAGRRNMNTLWAEAASKAFEKRPYKMHVEFMLSYMPQARGQARSNSGVYIDERYECQVLDSFGLEGENNECGGFYGMMKPKVNMCFPPLTWQTYDIDFTPAKWNGNNKTANARVTLKHNGVLIYDNIELPQHTPGRKDEGPEPLGVYLQGHGNKVQYRNIWIQYQDQPAAQAPAAEATTAGSEDQRRPRGNNERRGLGGRR